MDAERAHHLVAGQLKFWSSFGLIRGFISTLNQQKGISLNRQVLGLPFSNPIGLAAGFDKDAKFLKGMKALGFGFVEVGTVTPKPQVGNPKPRLFRLPKDQALINRMGFNNLGVDHMVQNLQDRPQGLIVGGNIGKNKTTPQEEAYQDYLICFDKLHPHVDYFVVNVSSPNTPGLRSLQDREPLTKILGSLQERNQKLGHKPLLLKIAPDLNNDQISEVVEVVKEQDLDGMVTTNTTISREGLNSPQQQVEKIGSGGLSGRPLGARAAEVTALVRQLAGEDLVIIGVGGIASGDDARAMMEAGANLIQVYSGLVYQGPKLIPEIKNSLNQYFS